MFVGGGYAVLKRLVLVVCASLFSVVVGKAAILCFVSFVFFFAVVLRVFLCFLFFFNCVFVLLCLASVRHCARVLSLLFRFFLCIVCACLGLGAWRSFTCVCCCCVSLVSRRLFRVFCQARRLRLLLLCIPRTIRIGHLFWLLLMFRV